MYLDHAADLADGIDATTINSRQLCDVAVQLDVTPVYRSVQFDNLCEIVGIVGAFWRAKRNRSAGEAIPIRHSRQSQGVLKQCIVVGREKSRRGTVLGSAVGNEPETGAHKSQVMVNSNY